MPPLLKIIWFFFPAAAANMAPVFMRNFPALATPIDFGRNIFGNNKTWRGIFFGLIAAIAVAVIQDLIAPNVFSFAVSANGADAVNATNIAGMANIAGITSFSESVIRGFLLGVGALGGDLLKSFFKRRIGIAPGKSFPIADQTDWILGVLAITALFYGALFASWSLEMLAIILVLFGSLHILTNLAGYFLGMRKQPI